MKVLTIGGATIDTIAIIASDRIERMALLNADTSFLLLPDGEKTEAAEISTHCGGGAVNAAVAMARLGQDVAALVKLGQDSRAETVLARLLDEGVSTRWAIRDARQPTGASVLLSSHDRNAAIFTFRGANTLLEPADLRKEAFAVDLVYITGLSNRSADCFPLIVDQAKSAGALVTANPGIRQLAARGLAFFDTLARIDVLSINSIEAGALVPSLVAKFGETRAWPELAAGDDAPRLARRGLSGSGYTMPLGGFFAAMRELCPSEVAVTDGRHGSYLGGHEAIVYCPVVPVEVAGTAGAGDAFTATLATYLATGRRAEEALAAAAINAASVVGVVDTQTGLLAEDELEKRRSKQAGELALRRWLV